MSRSSSYTKIIELKYQSLSLRLLLLLSSKSIETFVAMYSRTTRSHIYRAPLPSLTAADLLVF